MRLSRIFIFLLIGFLAAQFLFYYPNLPPQIASHFNAAGTADSWMSKENFIIFEAIILLIIISEFSILPLLIEKTPDSLINLPNKDYWLAGVLRTETFAVMRKFFDWFAAGLLALFIALNQTVFKANINQTNLPATVIWLILGSFLLFTLIWMIKFIGYFKIKRI